MEAFGWVVDSLYQLSVAWSFFVEPVLEIWKDWFVVQVIHDIVMDDMLKAFAWYAGQWYGPVVGWTSSLSFLGDQCNLLYSGSQSHTTRRGRASCSLWYAPVANVCDLLLFLDENRVIPEFGHFWKVTSSDEELCTVLYFPSDAFPMTWPRKLFTVLNSTGMWLRTLAYTRP